MPRGSVEGDTNMEETSKSFKTLTVQGQLQEALNHKALSFTGNYYHASVLSSTPNPCLSITGLGPIGLPLVEDYTQRIISVANLMNKDSYTSAMSVRGIWEIEPTQISFSNPNWERYVSDTLCQEVCTALGALSSAPKMELRKLLLYGEQANCTAHLNLQQAEDSFATVTVFLPSAYEGGEVLLSHASNVTTIKFAAQSAYSSAILATYTDVTHELRPISLGYCLALSYNIIHTTTSIESCPSLPKTLEATNLLRNVLCMWKDKIDTCDMEKYLMTYLLEHTYHLEDAGDVVASLKGVDAYRASILRDIGAELGITLGVATLECNFATISDVIKGPTTLTQLTGLDGEPLLGLTKPLNLPRASIVMVSDIGSKSSSGIKMQSDGRSNKDGKRSIFLLIERTYQDDLRFEVEGLSVAVQILRETAQIPPNRENIKWAERILQYRKKYHEEYTPGVFKEMLIHSLNWKNSELWKQSTNCYLWDFDYVHSDILFRAYRTFPFSEIHECFSEIMDNSSLWCENCTGRPEEIITFLHTLSAEAAKENGQETVRSWCEQSVEKVLVRCSPEGPSHAESVLQVIRLVGMQLCAQYMLPDLIDNVHEQYFDFWLALHTLLRDQRQSLLEDLSKSHPDPDVPTTANSLEKNAVTVRSTVNILDDLIQVSLCIPSITWYKRQWPDTSGSPLNSLFNSRREKFNPIPERIDRLLSVLDASVRSCDATLCESVLEQSLEMSGNLMWYFTEFYIPVISRLRDILAPLGQDITQPPFAKFLQQLIGRYLSQVLGKRGPVVDIGLRKLGCQKSDCDTCKKVDAFILSTQAEIQFQMDAQCYSHAEQRLEHAIDLCTYKRLNSGGPFRSRFRPILKIKKHESVVRCSDWDYRLSATKAFLESVGPDSDIEDIMGERYADVLTALAGRRKFAWDEKRNTAQIPQAVDAGDSFVPQDSNTTSKPSRTLRRSKRKRT